MVNTYTTQWVNVEDGDTTTHDPTDLTAEDNINILNAEIQWEGIETSESGSYTSYSTNTNTDSHTANETTDTHTWNDSNSGDSSAEAEFPLVGMVQYTFIHHNLVYKVENTSDSTVEVNIEYDTPSGGSDSISIGLPPGTHQVENFDNITTSYQGEQRGITDLNGSGNSLEMIVEVETVGENTTVDYDSASTSYPSVPSGYSFSRHRHRAWRGGDRVRNDYTYSDSVGDTESISTSAEGETVEIELETRGSDTNYYTNYYDTHDPSVSGDVSGSYSGTVNDGETTSWQTLSGLGTTPQTFDHSIEESEEAKFRFRFDWEYSLPEAVTGVGLTPIETTYKVAAVDPTDSALEYDCVRVHIAGYGLLALDIVPADSSDAIPLTFTHPIHGDLSFRNRQ